MLSHMVLFLFVVFVFGGWDEGVKQSNSSLETMLEE